MVVEKGFVAESGFFPSFGCSVELFSSLVLLLRSLCHHQCNLLFYDLMIFQRVHV
jgi:hypothetical protein